MAFSCDMCDKTFNRLVDFNRHINRKIPCNKDTSCYRCGKSFTHSGNLNRHLNNKTKCTDNRYMREMDLKIAEVTLKSDTIKLKTAEINLKCEEIKSGSSTITSNNSNNCINGDHNSMHVGDTHNVIHVNCGINYTIDEVNNMLISGDTNASLSNFIKLHFNNDEFPENKCVKLVNNKIFINLNDEMISYDFARTHFNDKALRQIECIVNDFIKYTDEEMDQNGLVQKKDYISKEKMLILEKLDPYIKNNRYKGEVKKAIVVAHN
jgi:uncharacterized C2H2 Zn-finger protein